MASQIYYGSKAQVFHGTAKMTKGGLVKADIKRISDSAGNYRYKSIKQQASGKKKNTFREKWSKAMKKARAQLTKEKVILKGEFVPVGGNTSKGKALYNRIKELLA